jgi:hypothetical protein
MMNSNINIKCSEQDKKEIMKILKAEKKRTYKPYSKIIIEALKESIKKEK